MALPFETPPSSRSSSSQGRLAAFAVLALTALLCAALIWAQPPTGIVQGVCVDAATGRPLADADVSLARKEEMVADESRSENAGKEAPPGWTQDSLDDGELGWSGGSRTPQSERRTRTDAQGRFLLTGVQTGEYSVYASSAQHFSDDAHTVIVAEGQKAQVSLPLKRAESRISFSAATLDWTPAESPTLPLNGALLTRTLQMTLERLDTSGALTHQPLLLAPSLYGGQNEKTRWAGEFTPVHRWTYTITHTDREGAFYERIPLDPLPPGLYRVTAEATEDGKVVSTNGWVRISRLALVRKTFGDQTLAFVTDLTTGQPVAGVDVRLLSDTDPGDARLLGEATTGPDGLARVSAAGAAPESRGVLVAQSGTSTVALSLTLNTVVSRETGDENDSEGDIAPEGSEPDSGARSLRSFVYTDRPVYRPGQTVSLKGIHRWFDRGQGYALPANRPVVVDVRDPQDTLVKHLELTTDALGSWNSALALSPEALTGEYTAKVTLDGHSEQSTFTVAAYHKPEYQTVVTFSRDRYVHGDTVDATITATYYYGAPVVGAKAMLSATKTDTESDSESDSGGEYAGSGEPTEEKEVTLDGNGQAHFRIPTEPGGVSGDTSYTVEAIVNDTSGRSVSGTASVQVAQGEFSLSATPDVYAAHRGDTIKVQATAADAQNKPLPGQSLQVTAGFEAGTPDGKTKTTPLKDVSVVTGTDGSVQIPLTASGTGLLTVHLSGRDRRGNTVTADTEIWVPGQAGDSDLALPSRLSDLSLVLDRDRYQPGQTAHLLINTAHPGPTALVTIEGATLYKAFPVPLSRRSNAVDLPITADDAPSVTIKVCAISDKRFLSSDRLLQVSDAPQRTLSVEVRTDKPAYHPGDPATLTVLTRDAAGRPVPAEVSLAVVDSAVYAIQPEAPGTIGDAFLPAQGDMVDTDYSNKVVTLGDADKGATNIDIRRKFPDTALWKPALQTGPDGLAQVQMTLPDTLTTWKLTSYGHTADTRVGKGVATVTVSKDLLVRLEAPPFLVSGDTSRLIGLVHNNTARTLSASVRLSAPGLSVEGDTTRTVTVAPGQPARLVWTVTAPAAGESALPIAAQLTASAGGLSDGVEASIPQLPHGVVQNVWHSGTLLSQVSQSLSVDPKAQPLASKLVVRLSPSISTTLLPATIYLSGYPYESTDATGSALIADAALASTPGLGIGAGEKAKLQNVVARSVLRLARLQRDDGGWGWLSTSNPDLWMTAWAAWSLSRAAKSGFSVNSKILSAAQAEMATLAETERGHKMQTPDEASLSLAALAFAESGDTKNAALNLRWLETRWAAPNALPRPADLARAALAEQTLGADRLGAAQTLMRRLWGVSRQTGTLFSWAGGGHRDAAGAATETPEADATSWALLAGERITPTDPRLEGAARWLMTARRGDHWTAPAPTAVVVSALALSLARSQEASPNFVARVLVNGHLVHTQIFTSESLQQPETSFDVPGTALAAGENTVTLQKTGPGRLYYALDLRQGLRQTAPVPPPSFWSRAWNAVFHPGGTPLPPAPSGYRIKRVYLRTTTRRSWLWEDSVPAPANSLHVGEGVLVRLIINATRPASRIVIEDPLPAGFRVAEPSSADAGDWLNWWDGTDVRDDKIVFFISDLTPGEHEIDYHLQAATPGAYDIMPPQISSTVDPSLSLFGKSAHLTVDAKE